MKILATLLWLVGGWLDTTYIKATALNISLELPDLFLPVLDMPSRPG